MGYTISGCNCCDPCCYHAIDEHETLNVDIYAGGNGPFSITIDRQVHPISGDFYWVQTGSITIQCTDGTNGTYDVSISELTILKQSAPDSDCYVGTVTLDGPFEANEFACNESIGLHGVDGSMSCDPLFLVLEYDGVDGIHCCFDIRFEIMP